MRYRYSNTLVYNAFPWPTPTEHQKLKIEQTAQTTPVQQQMEQLTLTPEDSEKAGLPSHEQ